MPQERCRWSFSRLAKPLSHSRRRVATRLTQVSDAGELTLRPETAGIHHHHHNRRRSERDRRHRGSFPGLEPGGLRPCSHAEDPALHDGGRRGHRDGPADRREPAGGPGVGHGLHALRDRAVEHPQRAEDLSVHAQYVDGEEQRHLERRADDHSRRRRGRDDVHLRPAGGHLYRRRLHPAPERRPVRPLRPRAVGGPARSPGHALRAKHLGRRRSIRDSAAGQRASTPMSKARWASTPRPTSAAPSTYRSEPRRPSGSPGWCASTTATPPTWPTTFAPAATVTSTTRTSRVYAPRCA